MATSSTFAHINESLGLLAFTPEVTQGTPNYSFTADGGSTTTITVDTTDGQTHNNAIASAADDSFNGLQIYFITGAEAGNVATITDFAVSGGTATFTFAALTTGGASGATFYVLGVLRASDVSIDAGPEDIETNFIRQTLDPSPSKKGLDKASGSFKFEIPGLSSPSADGSAASEDRISKFLEAYGARSAGTGEAVTGSSSTTTQVDITDASLFTVGDYVLINNQVRRVTTVDTASTPDNIIVSPALNAAPAASDVVYQAEIWTPDDTGHRSHTFLRLTDDRLLAVTGAVCSFKFSAEQYGALLMGECEFDGDGFSYSDGVSMDASQLNKCSPLFIEPDNKANCHFGTTELGVNSFEFDVQHGRQELRDTSAGLRFDVRSRAASCKVVFRDQVKTPKTSWEDGATEDHLIIACGSTSGDCVAIAGNSQVKTLASTGVNDTQYWDAEFTFVDPQTDAATPKKPKLLRF